MECAGRGSQTPCCGAPVRRCQRCRAVAYCSLSHQISHRSVHKRECERLRQQMKRADILNEFPFTFTQEAAQIQETRCSFLTRHGIHRLGMWMCECNCETSTKSSENSRLITYWNLPYELCPCKGPSSPLSNRLTNWKDYYEWRCIPLYSPIALLLHWVLRVDPIHDNKFIGVECMHEFPLTIYWAIQLAILESLLPETNNELRIHYLGPEKELLQLAVFRELQALFPGVKVHIDLVGPAISHLRDGEKIELYTYAQCNAMDCGCKSTVENHSCAITLQLHAGYYHDCYRELLKDSFPHIIIGPNAGLAAYTSWLPTLEVIKELKVAAIFSDYCEEASHLAASCISSITGSAPKIQIQVNPFRHPLPVEQSVLCVPCHSNCFLFGL